ncbi:Ras family domain-containing protein, partial [Reticulomyxa filosa]
MKNRGADFRVKEMEVDGKQFRALGGPFYRGTNACVLVFDLSDQQSFEAIPSWREEVLAQGNVEWVDTIPFFVIGNKCDLEKDRKFSSDWIQQQIKNKEWPNTIYLETSAKTGTGIHDLFEQVAKRSFALMSG